MHEPIFFRPSAAAIPSRLKLWAGRISWAAVPPFILFAASFGRTVILSRLLAPGEFGIAVAITVVITTAELATDVGLEKFILLKPAAEARRALAAAHALMIFRGLLLAAAIAVLAVPAVTFFGVPQAVGSFEFAALVPLVRSFGHLGITQIQRDYEYRPEARARMASSVAGLAVAALAAATILPDHRVILVAFLVDAAVYVAVSHILAHAPMRVIPDREMLRQSLAYGLPLMLNGVGLALISQADRVVVGRFFGMDILGVYAVVLGLAMAPPSLLLQTTGGLGIAMLARSQDNPKRYLETYLWLAWFFAFLAFGYAAFIGLTLDVLVPLVFGKAYAVAIGPVILISAIVFLRILRGGPTVALLVSGATTRLTLANLMSVFGIAAAAALAQVHLVLTSVLAGVLFGDVLTMVLLQRAAVARIPNGIGSLWRCFAVAGAGVAILTMTLRLLPEPSWANRGIVAISGALPAAILGWGVLSRWRLRERT
ncbi:MAG: oligosaccharide flippase family protein [Acidobacteriales bacterium]|nr:oligosaccharide flippase family protein [Terriglobales bacterium]